MKLLPYDIEAKIYALTRDEGGRHRPFRTGYRPSICFEERRFDVVILFDDPNEIDGGEYVTVRISFFKPELQRHRLHVGQQFKITEASHVVGKGVITSIANEELCK